MLYRFTQTGKHYDCTAVQLIQSKYLILKSQNKYEWANQSIRRPYWGQKRNAAFVVSAKDFFVLLFVFPASIWVTKA